MKISKRKFGAGLREWRVAECGSNDAELDGGERRLQLEETGVRRALPAADERAQPP